MAYNHEPWDSALESNSDSPGCFTMLIIFIIAAISEIRRAVQKGNL